MDFGGLDVGKGTLLLRVVVALTSPAGGGGTAAVAILWSGRSGRRGGVQREWKSVEVLLIQRNLQDNLVDNNSRGY